MNDAPDPSRAVESTAGLSDDISRVIADKVPELKKLPESDRIRVVKKVTSRSIQFAGPLPPPEHLARYDAIAPGSALRIKAMAESDLAHTHAVQIQALELQRKELERAAADRRSDQIYRMSGLVMAGVAMSMVLGTAMWFASLNIRRLRLGSAG